MFLSQSKKKFKFLLHDNSTKTKNYIFFCKSFLLNSTDHYRSMGLDKGYYNICII